MQNNKKLEGGTLLRPEEIFRKELQRRKNPKRDSLDSSGFVGYVKKVKIERRDPLETEKISKVAQCRKKIERGDSLVPSGFVGYLEKVKNERGTLWTKFCTGWTWP